MTNTESYQYVELRSLIIQDFSLNHNDENIFYSQNLAFSLGSANSIMIGYSMMDRASIETENSSFNLKYALNLADFLYMGVGFQYRDRHYKKYDRKNLKTDLGIIASLKGGHIIRYLNSYQ